MNTNASAYERTTNSAAEDATTMKPVSMLSVPRAMLLRVLLWPADRILSFIGPRYTLYFWFYTNTPASWIEALGRMRMRRAVDAAARQVPAYRSHLAESGNQSHVPETDKWSYVAKYSPEDRCVGGKLPTCEVAIDESSGSTGVPFNWIRSAEERAVSHFFISHFAHYAFGDRPWITINAFSMGAWATGVNMGIALQKNSIVKNTGPDMQKIFRTLEYFGTSHRYLVCGYPPFLKRLIDEAKAQGFPLEDYSLMALLGGEGNSEGLRDYLYSQFNPIYSGYGATDIEIGLAGETPMSLAIRRAARDNDSLKSRLFGDDGRLPMVFQYNPLMHHIEVNDDGELIFTITRLNVLTPKIRYNIHDAGGVATFAEMKERLMSEGVDFDALAAESGANPVPMPFLWIYGRKDSTVSIMGANVYPEDIEECLYREPELAAATSSYCISLEDDGPESRLVCSFELRSGEPDDALYDRFEESIERNLIDLNADFREAHYEHPTAVRPIIHLHRMGEGPFAKDSSKIKQTRLLAAR